jgi:P4 family phage/plasmid primase-like protien
MADDGISRVYPLFFHPGEVVELRALGVRGNSPAWEGWANGTVYGFFDNTEDFSKAAAAIDKAGGKGTYFTANPVNADLLARAANRLKSGVDGMSAADKDIVCSRWLLVDVDPVRSAGISSTGEELELAGQVGAELTAWLEGTCDWPAGVRALSGNGYHIMYRLPDQAPAPEISGSGGMLHKALQALNARFGRPGVIKIDQVNYNPSRIWKLYGTMARKGDSTPLRPHRRASLAGSAPDRLELVREISLQQLQELADQAPEPEKKAAAAPAAAQGGSPAAGGGNKPAAKGGRQGDGRPQLGKLKLDEYLAFYNIEVTATKPVGNGMLYAFDQCVFNAEHQGHKCCGLVSSDTPPHITYQCFHDTCKGKTWKDARLLISGDAKLAKFCEGYDPNWRPPDKVATQYREPNEDEKAALFDVVPGAPGVPHPSEMEWAEFFENVDGKRPSFRQKRLMDYLQRYLAPVVHTAGEYWRYSTGLWQEIDSAEVGKVAAVALGPQMQVSRVNDAIKGLSFFANMEERQWTWATNKVGNLVNVANGMLDIEKFELLPHRADYYLRTQVATAFDPYAECQLWIKTIHDIFQGEPCKVLVLQEFMGYMLLPTCRFEKCAFFFGTGANGKSTVLDVITWLLGEDNVSALSLEAMSRQFPLVSLRGKMMNSATEVDTKDVAGTENLKKIISGDLLSSDTKFGKQITFRTFCKCIFAMNTPPAITDKAFGFVRKVLVLNFNRRFTEDERDKYLRDKLREQELPGILNWAVEGARRLLRQGRFTDDKILRSDAADFMAKMNNILAFVMDCCVLHPNVHGESNELFKEYKEWADAKLYRKVGQGKFGDQLESLDGVKKERHRVGGHRPTVFRGIGLRKVWAEVIGEGEERKLEL